MKGTRPEGDEELGLTLIELIVAVLVASVLLAAAAAILSNSWTTQRNVTSVSDATNRGQLISSGVERAMRNAIAFDVSVDGTTLRVHTSLGGSLTCQGFALVSGESRMSLSSSALSASTNWPSWQAGIQQQGSSPYFTQSGSQVAYRFDIGTSSAPVRFVGQAGTRTASTGVSAPCW
jgi:prepilin-type N-terminal cleavage/methylation domain-containing protein